MAYPTVSHINKTLVVPVDEVLVFKDALDKCLEANVFETFFLS